MQMEYISSSFFLLLFYNRILQILSSKIFLHVSIMTEQETGRRLSVGRGGEDMLLNTYKKVMDLFESGNGYRDASELKDAKFKTVQIK